MRKIIFFFLFLVFLSSGVAMAALVDNGNTVTDTATGLMWQKATAPDPGNPGNPGTYTWQGALVYAEALDLAGHTDWRLPNRNELQSLVDYSLSTPPLIAELFTGTVSSKYWSSTTFAGGVSNAWWVSFETGGIAYDIKTNANYVRAVRTVQYTLTYTAGANGTIVGTSPQTVNHGLSGALVTATPNTGFHFVSWSDGYPTAARTDTNVTADITATATFAINQYTLTYTAGTGGTIVGTSPQTVNHGLSGALVTATPNTGFHFVSWSDGYPTAARTDTNVTADITATATFAINQYTLTYTAGTGGTIVGTSPQTVNHGLSGALVTATPNTGFHFVSWSDGYPTAARTDTNVTADITATATFAINQYTLTYTAGTGGTIVGTSPQTVNHGLSGALVTATPNTGFHFVSWSDGYPTAARTDTNVTADITATATFAINQYTLTYTAGTGGTIVGTSPQTVNHGLSGALVTATPNTGFHFVSWSDGYPTAARTDTNVTADITATATFAINQYTLTYTAGTGGTIVGTSPQTVNHGLSGALVTATPNTGFHFVSWSDGYPTAARTDTNVTADITATATFAINQYTLTYTAGTGGTIVGTSPQTVNHGLSGALVTATPNTGFHFVSWSDGYPTAARTDTNVTADITATATFAINQYTLTYTATSGTIVGTSPQTVNHGASGTLVTATPNTGFHFVSWSDGILTAARTDTSVTANINVTATFAINQYTVTPSAGANGAISPSTPQTVNHGATTAFRVTANTGYAASVGGACGGTLVGTTYTTGVITGPCTVEATFVQLTIPVIQVTPVSLNFVYVPVGSMKDMLLTVKNIGVGTLTGDATTTAPFSIISDGSYNLESDQSQVVTIRYQPISPGINTGTVVFTGGGGATVPVTGRTVEPSKPLCCCYWINIDELP